MRRIVPEFIQTLLRAAQAGRAALPTYGVDDWESRPSPYRRQACQPGVDYVWLEYVLDAGEAIVSRFDRDSVTQAWQALPEADHLRHTLDWSGWTLQYRTSHKEGYSYLYGRHKQP